MLPYLFILICLGALIRGSKKRSRIDYWPFVVAVIFGFLAAVVQVPKLLPVPYFETDFSDYCIGILALEDPSIPIPPKRTRLAALLPYLVSQKFGILNGLAGAAWLSTGLIGAGLYVWGRAIAGHMAGLGAACLALCMAPLVGLSRFVNFYPEIVLCFVWAAAWVSVAYRRRTPASLFWPGLGVGLCLLIDARGLIWALPYACASIFCALSCKGWKKKLLALLIFGLPIYISWYGGWWSYAAYSSPLEKQIDVRPLFVGFDEENPILKPPWNYPSQFIWGWTPIGGLPETIRFLWVQKNIPAPQGFLDWQNALRLQVDYFQVWRDFGLWTGVISMVGLLWKPWRMLGLLASTGPFIVAFIGIESMVEQHIRFFTHALPAIAILGGVAAAQMVRLGTLVKRFQFLPRSLGRVVFALFAVFLMIGVLPSWLSPDIGWRPVWKISARNIAKIQKMATDGVDFQDNSWDADCARAIQAEGLIDITIYPTWDGKITPGWGGHPSTVPGSQ